MKPSGEQSRNLPASCPLRLGKLVFPEGAEVTSVTLTKAGAKVTGGVKARTPVQGHSAFLPQGLSWAPASQHGLAPA